MDETWVHHFEPESKYQRLVWKHPTFPTQKKPHTAVGKLIDYDNIWGYGRCIVFGYFTTKDETVDYDNWCDSASRQSLILYAQQNSTCL